ncbi:MAG: helix-turn-helix domain-containing protein [Euzebya sp.]
MSAINNTEEKNPVKRLLTINEVADILGVSVRHVRRLRQERRIKVVKWSHLLRFDPADVQALIDEHREDSVERR